MPDGARVIDDELLQELLVRATGLYNNGDYKGAIAAWKEALEVDPSSQKAREGIQMATLLLADWDPAAPPEPEPAPPADGAAATPSPDPDADARRIDQGVKRVRGLILERKYSEAIEGARGLVPIDPDSDEVQRLVEEAQQAFESSPFIDEHLTLSRELLEQGRRAEAEAECRKVFALDPANPDAHALLATIQKGAATPAPAAPEPTGDLGGRTMRIDRSQLQAFQIPPEAADPLPEAVVEELPVEAVEPDPERLEIIDLSADPGGPPGNEETPVAATEAEPEPDFPADVSIDAVAAGPEAAEPELPEIDLEGLDLDAPLEIPAPVAPAVDEPAGGAIASAEAGPAAEESLETLAVELPALPAPDEPAAAPAVDEPEVIEATTVVPPSVRLVERSPENQAELDRLMNQLDEDPETIESIPLAIPTAAAGPAAPPAPSSRAASRDEAPGHPDAAWEKELESLNQKTGSHELVGRSAARTATPEAAPDEDVDLTALMGDEIGPLQAPPEAHEGPPAEALHPAPAPPPVYEPALAIPMERPAARQRERSAARFANMSPPAVERRAGLTTSLFAIGGLVILAVGAVVWWFFFQPRNATGRSQPPTAAAPPSASSAADVADPGPIPTPIGSSSKQNQQGARPEDGAVGDTPAGPTGVPTVQENPPVAVVPSGASLQPANPGASRTGGAAAPPAAAARPRTAEEIRQETAQHLAAGKSFLAAERWQEARRELAAALALDPVNFECKELLEQAQAKVNQETKVTQDYDEARRLFQDKDYQGALWKLYRLPKDPRFGDVDVAIRNAWYNWAVVALKGGDATTATQKLNEVFQVDPADADAEKIMEVATRYASRPKDKGFYSFVDTLRLRSIDGR